MFAFTVSKDFSAQIGILICLISYLTSTVNSYPGQA